jgi:hypothetical protein
VAGSLTHEDVFVEFLYCSYVICYI